jgi:hypothetical protein
VAAPDAEYGPSGVALIVRRRMAEKSPPQTETDLLVTACELIGGVVTREEETAWGRYNDVAVSPDVEGAEEMTLHRQLAALSTEERSAAQVVRWFDAHGDAAVEEIVGPLAHQEDPRGLALAILIAAVNFGIIVENNWPYPPNAEPVLDLARRAAAVLAYEEIPR